LVSCGKRELEQGRDKAGSVNGEQICARARKKYRMLIEQAFRRHISWQTLMDSTWSKPRRVQIIGYTREEFSN